MKQSVMKIELTTAQAAFIHVFMGQLVERVEQGGFDPLINKHVDTAKEIMHRIDNPVEYM